MKNDYLRELKSIQFQPERLTDEFLDFVKEELLPELDIIKGYKKKQKIETASQIIANLILASNRNMVIGDSRDTKSADVRMRVTIWDALITNKLAISCLGSEQSGKVTRYSATDELRRRLSDWKLQKILNVQLERNSNRVIPIHDALVVLKPRRKQRETFKDVLPIPDSEQVDVENTENQLDFINRSNLRHSWQAFVTDERGRERIEQPDVMLQQQHCETMYDWVRIYTSTRWGAQGLSKELRKRILIDGEPVAELDFSCSQLRLLYHLANQNPDPEDDLYRPKEIMSTGHRRRRKDTRKLVKLATTITMNARNHVQAAAAIKNGIRDDEDLQGLLELQGINAATLVRRIVSEHSVPFLPDMGPKLMTLESTIMLNICMKFALQGTVTQRRELDEDEQLEEFGEILASGSVSVGLPFGKPLLPIHDGVLCKQSDVDFAEQTMIDEYRFLMRYDPVIKQEY